MQAATDESRIKQSLKVFTDATGRRAAVRWLGTMGLSLLTALDRADGADDRKTTKSGGGANNRNRNRGVQDETIRTAKKKGKGKTKAGPTGPVGPIGPAGPPGPAGTSGTAVTTVAAFGTTTSTSYTDLATFGPSVSVMVPASGRVLVTLTAFLEADADSSARMSFTSAGGSGNVTAEDARSLTSLQPAFRGSATYPVAGLSPGGHTFTAKYRGAGAGSAHFADRSLIVIPLP